MTRQEILTNKLEDGFLCAESLIEFGSIPSKNMTASGQKHSSSAHQAVERNKTKHIQFLVNS